MILEVRDVVRTFGGVRAVDGASLDVEQGSITALIGPNGAGKSTLFNVVSGFLRANRGTVRFEGRRIERSPAYRIARGGLVRTFQMPRTVTRLSVLENLLLVTPQVERAHELLALVRLEPHANEYAGVLSGGQRKLLDFARVLMAGPRLVLLDEPMAGVNPALGRQLVEHVLQLREEAGMTFLFVEHDMDVVMEAADTVIVMSEGRVIASGTPDEIRSDEAVVDAYLGTSAPV